MSKPPSFQTKGRYAMKERSRDETKQPDEYVEDPSIEIGWMVAVGRRLNGEGFFIPCYRTAAVKKGGDVWKRR
jgi:hypothetical protein